MKPFSKFLSLLVVATSLAVCTQAFAPLAAVRTGSTTLPISTTTTSLQERRWNFNEGQSPWGMKANAEIWNGRMAQVAFVFVFLQELVQGKGIIEGIQQGDPVNMAALALAGVSIVGLTAFLAIQGDDDYVTRELERE